MTPSSSSDSEADEERKKLRLALDPDFVSGTTCVQHINHIHKETKGETSTHHVLVDELPASKRPRLFDNSSSEFAKPYSLDVTPECQKFIAKQLSKSLERNLKEVSSSIQEVPPSTHCGIKLFASSTSSITEDDLQRQRVARPPRRRNLKKKKSNKTKDNDESSSESENERLKSVAVTADWVFNSM